MAIFKPIISFKNCFSSFVYYQLRFCQSKVRINVRPHPDRIIIWPDACWYLIIVSRGSTYAAVPIFKVFIFLIEPAILVVFQDGGRKRAKRSETISRVWLGWPSTKGRKSTVVLFKGLRNCLFILICPFFCYLLGDF